MLILLIVLLILIILLLVARYCSLAGALETLTQQLDETRPLRVPLVHPRLERLAEAIDARARREKVLRSQLLHNEEALRQTGTAISHDLRTPLTAMRGYLTLLAETDDADRRAHYLRVLQERCDYLAALIDSLYTLSLLEEGATQPVSFDLGALLADRLLDNYAALAQNPPQIHLPEDPVMVCAQPLACQRIIDNLLANAQRYSAVNGGEATPENKRCPFSVALTQDATLTIANPCTFLDETALSHLFERFTTAHPPQKAGSGLGLSIVCALLDEQHLPPPRAVYRDGQLVITVQFHQ